MDRAKLNEIELHKSLAKGYRDLREKDRNSGYYDKVWLISMIVILKKRRKN